MESGILQSGRVILLSTSQYTKDGDIVVNNAAVSAAAAMRQTVEQQLMVGLATDSIVWLNNNPDVISVKEQIALAAEQANDLLLIYIAGTAVLRRGQIYITLPHSTLSQIHVNGLSIQELADIVREPEGAHKLFILDCHFSGDAADMAQAVREELHRHAAKLKKSFLIAQPWLEGRETLGQQISRILQEGVPKPQEALTLEDLCQELNETAQRHRQPEPIMAAKKHTLSLTIAANQRYKEFRRLFAEARRAFDKQNFDAALTAFSQAQGLYPNDDETSTHIRFIHRYQEAEQFYAQRQYMLARRAYETALGLIPASFLLEKIERTTADLANHYFELQQYDQAKAAYARLVSDHPGNTFYLERLQISTNEHRYHELIDKADNHYFRYEFVEALEAYREALTIHTDTKTERRAQECQRYVDVLVYLQQKAEADVRARIEAELRQKADTEVAERVAQLQKELTARIEQETAQKMQEKYDAMVWDAALQSNQRAAINLYRTLFPQGAFIDQADYWLSLHQESVYASAPPADTPAEKQIPVFNPEEKTEASIPATIHTTPPPEVTQQETQRAAEVQLDEETLWSRALAADTIEGYMEYISKTVDSEHIADAYYRISRIRNAASEFQTGDTPTAPYSESSGFFSMNGYTERPPESLSPDTPTFVDQTFLTPATDLTPRDSSGEQFEEELWREAQAEHTSQAYQNYLNRSIQLKYADQAREQITDLQEKERMQEALDWEKASSQDTLEAYKAYIGKYPFGNFYAKARFRIARLESEIN
ncbi:tetratricopeptide repeat protein [Rhodoflexus sp.]